MDGNEPAARDAPSMQSSSKAHQSRGSKVSAAAKWPSASFCRLDSRQMRPRRYCPAAPPGTICNACDMPQTLQQATDTPASIMWQSADPGFVPGDRMVPQLHGSQTLNSQLNDNVLKPRPVQAQRGKLASIFSCLLVSTTHCNSIAALKPVGTLPAATREVACNAAVTQPDQASVPRTLMDICPRLHL